MGKRILKDDIAEPGVLENLLKPLSELKELIEATSTLMTSFAKDAKELLGFKTDAKGLREQEALMRKIQKAYEAKIKAEKEALRLAREIDKVQKDRWSAEQSLQKQREKALNDIAKQEARTLSQRQSAEQSLQRQRERGLAQMEKERAKAAELNRPYVQLDLTLKKLRKEYQDLAASGQTNTTRARELRAEMNRLNTTLNSIDADTGVYTRNVGNYTESIKKGFKGAMNVIGQFGLALGGVALAKGAIDTIVEFDTKMADLSAITGLAGKELDFFKENAIKMGVDVKGGASAVVEAYKLIASAKPELLDNAAALNKVTEAAILLSRASGMELPDAATALTDAMNQFGAGADQAGKFVDVLAAGAKFGSAEIPQITEALLKFGAVAKTTNVNVQESTALIEDLAEKGLKGADAGTALRNVMLKLSAPDALPKDAQRRLKELGVNFDVLRDKSKPFAERLEELKPLLNDNAALVKTFGTENAVAATTLISTTDRIKELTASVNENGVAQEQANTRSKTLSEAYNRFKETINGLILEFANGSNAAGGLVSALDFLRKNIKTIIKVAYELIKVFIIFKTVMKALELKKAYDEWKDLADGIGSVTDGLEEGATAGSKFGATMKTIGFSALISLALELAQAFYSIASGAKQAEIDTRNLENANKQGEKRGAKNIKEAQKARDAELKLVRMQLKNNLISKEDALKQEVKITQQYNDKINNLSKQSAKKQAENFKAYQENLSKINEIRREVGDTVFEALRSVALSEQEGGINSGVLGVSNAVFNEQAKVLGDLLQKQSVYKAQQQGLKTSGNLYNAELLETNKLLEENSAGLDVSSSKHEANKRKLKESTDQINALNDVLKEQEELINDNALSEFEKDLASTLKSQFTAINEDGVYSLDIMQRLIDAEKERRRQIIETQFLIDSGGVDLQTASALPFEQTTQVQMALEKRNKAVYDLDEEFVAIEMDALNQIDQAGEEKLQKTLARLEAEHEAKLTKIDRQLKDEELLLLQSNKSKEAIEKELLDSEIIILQEKIDLQREYGNDAIDLEIELANKKRQQQEKADSDEKARLEKMAKFRNEIIKQGTEYLTDQIDKQIAIEQKKSDDSARLEDLLSEKAKEGNIAANESIIEQQRIQEEADRKKIELERRKANIIAVSSLLQSFNNKVNAGDKFALAETAVESGALLALLNSLPKFYGGTKTTVGAESKALKPGKDGHLSWVDHEERILEPKLSNKIPTNVTNSQLVDGYLDSVSGKFATGSMMYRENIKQDVAGNSFDIAPLLRQNQELIDAVNAIPSQQLTADQVAMGIMKLMAISKTNGVTTRNEYVIRK